MTRPTHSAILAALAMALITSSALAQTAPLVDAFASEAALAQLPGPGAAKLKVSTPAFRTGGDIPFENTQYRGNHFPGLSWSPGPKGTKAYVVVMQDTDVKRGGGPLVHWTMVNIPAGMTSLNARLTVPPPGASFGPNVRGPSQPYMGPRTPPGPKHHYHLQVFAVDGLVPAEALTTYDALAASLKGHVLAGGEVVGLGRADPTAPPPPAPTPAPAKP